MAFGELEAGPRVAMILTLRRRIKGAFLGLGRFHCPYGNVLSNEYDTEVIYIRIAWPRFYQITDLVKKTA